jgi:hypothetical protein
MEPEVIQKRIFPSITSRDYSLNRVSLNRIIVGAAGALLGYSISIALGMALVPSIALAAFLAISVLVAGSLSTALFTQSILLAVLSAIVFAIFRLWPATLLNYQTVQLIFLTGLMLAPLISRLPTFLNGFQKLAPPPLVQLVASGLFGVLVVLLRERMPANSGYALTRLYGMEDNAGISGDLAMFLDSGLSSQVSSLGSVTNGLYLSAAGLISQFGTEDSLALLAPLTHWNMTLLFLAWTPLASLCIIAASGKKIGNLKAIATLVISSILLTVLFWPFIGFGHTSVISAGLFGSVLLALTSNRQLSSNHPFLFLSLVVSLSFIVGNIWFPLLPFSAAVTALSFVAVLANQFHKGHKRAVLSIVLVASVIGLLLLPQVVRVALANSSLIVQSGATRTPTQLLILVWLALVFASTLWLSRDQNSKDSAKNSLFMASIGILLLSNIYLVSSGMLANSGSLGYGANKYLLTSIALSIPVLWVSLVSSKRGLSALGAVTSGLVLTFSVSIFQPDQGLILNTGVVSISPAATKPQESNVVSAIREAIETNPQNILCVSDNGKPMIVEGAQWNSDQWDAYICTRWADSLSGNAGIEGGLWRGTMINTRPIETLRAIRDSFQDRRVTIIRFPGKTEASTEIVAEEDTWWFEYVDSSWRVVSVKN